MNDWIDDFRKEFSHYFDEKQKHLFRAELLGSDGHVLSIGRAILPPFSCEATFWPEAKMDIVPSLVASLKDSTGRVICIRQFQRCKSLFEHYHFEVQP